MARETMNEIRRQEATFRVQEADNTPQRHHHLSNCQSPTPISTQECPDPPGNPLNLSAQDTSTFNSRSEPNPSQKLHAFMKLSQRQVIPSSRRRRRRRQRTHRRLRPLSRVRPSLPLVRRWKERVRRILPTAARQVVRLRIVDHNNLRGGRSLCARRDVFRRRELLVLLWYRRAVIL